MKKGPREEPPEGDQPTGLGRDVPEEQAATKWFEAQVWPTERGCPKCGSVKTQRGSEPEADALLVLRLPVVLLRANGDGAGTVEGSASEVGLRHLHRDHQPQERVQHETPPGNLGVTQRTAWFMLHRLREAWAAACPDTFDGPVEVDEMSMGGKEKNKPKSKAGWRPGRHGREDGGARSQGQGDEPGNGAGHRPGEPAPR